MRESEKRAALTQPDADTETLTAACARTIRSALRQRPEVSDAATQRLIDVAERTLEADDARARNGAGRILAQLQDLELRRAALAVTAARDQRDADTELALARLEVLERELQARRTAIPAVQAPASLQP